MKLATIFILLTPFIIGCAGNADCNFVITNFNTISVDPTDAKAFKFRCNECYWWVDKTGRLNIAGKGINKSLLNSALDKEFYISFVLGAPSKGIGKNYKLNYQSVRGLLKMGANIYRFKSTYGILGIENRKNKIIKAAYRANIRVYAARLLGGWSKASPFLMYGTLEAIFDSSGKGQKIRKITEQMGYSRHLSDKLVN